jgi:hypothetical protein
VDAPARSSAGGKGIAPESFGDDRSVLEGGNTLPYPTDVGAAFVLRGRRGYLVYSAGNSVGGSRVGLAAWGVESHDGREESV